MERAPLGRPLSRFQVGTGLAALVAGTNEAEFEALLDCVLEPRGIHAVQEVMAEIDRLAGELHERSGAHHEAG